MSARVTFLVLITLLRYDVGAQRTCKPNSYFTVNGRLCYCDYLGRWAESNCKVITRRQSCQPGQMIWQGCNRCICQENGQLSCTDENCYTDSSKNHAFSQYGSICTPYRSYYVNCSLCFCPASGSTSKAQCVIDASCSVDPNTSDIQTLAKSNQCIPNVMYLFPCTQCLCSENGYFILDKCLEKCHVKPKRRCIPGAIYRDNCNVCRCPDDSIPDEKLCVKGLCGKKKHLRTTPNHCVPHTFTKPICLYCDCSSEGTVNERSCLELECSKALDFKTYTETDVCSPGELVPICIECFCLNDGRTKDIYCTRVCTFQSKLNVLEKLLNHSLTDFSLIDKSKIIRTRIGEECERNTLYIDEGRYCLCSNNINGNLKFCTSFVENIEKVAETTNLLSENQIDLTQDCEPNTLVDFGCNTCYCNKNGKIDSKWCTEDDCEAKRIVEESHKVQPYINPVKDADGPCIPGSISKINCNFCICPDSGSLKERVCTKNMCEEKTAILYEKFTCEPLAYYEVDCNICYCPQDGLKNVAMCSKNQCGKSFLRSTECIPGNLFSDECNVCVCPPNGDKADKVCMNHTCSLPPWNTFKLSNTLDNQVKDDSTRSLDLCYPGEEFVMGCNLCVCPDLGLKVYATCDAVLCKDNFVSFRNISKDDSERTSENSENEANFLYHARIKREDHKTCFLINISHSAERKECTPGTMYIIRCKECICPYIGTINNFCRPLPKSTFCEEAYPGFNYLSMGRRKQANLTSIKTKDKYYTLAVKHSNHTIHRCGKPGTLMDRCYMCQCENNIMIEEHCFKSDARNCTDAKINFIEDNKVISL